MFLKEEEGRQGGKAPAVCVIHPHSVVVIIIVMIMMMRMTCWQNEDDVHNHDLVDHEHDEYDENKKISRGKST